MREYDELYDWLAQSKLLAYMDNFAAAGFDLSAMVGLTPEVSAFKMHDYFTFYKHIYGHKVSCTK